MAKKSSSTDRKEVIQTSCLFRHMPVKIRNRTFSGEDYTVNKWSKLEEANNHDINYEYKATKALAEPTVLLLDWLLIWRKGCVYHAQPCFWKSVMKKR